MGGVVLRQPSWLGRGGKGEKGAGSQVVRRAARRAEAEGAAPVRRLWAGSGGSGGLAGAGGRFWLRGSAKGLPRPPEAPCRAAHGSGVWEELCPVAGERAREGLQRSEGGGGPAVRVRRRGGPAGQG